MRFILSVVVGMVLSVNTHAQERVDLELVLAVDASASVSADEYQLQLQGIANAFRTASVQRAIASGPIQKIAVQIVIWAEAGEPKRTGDWFAVKTADDAERFASYVENFGRQLIGGTGIGDGILHSIEQIMTNQFEGTRRVVDVSGDGRESISDLIYLFVGIARQKADQHDVTINGLAILTNDQTLDEYYRQEVATGPGNFVLSAASYQDFANAIKKKLLLEIGTPPLAALE